MNKLFFLCLFIMPQILFSNNENNNKQQFFFQSHNHTPDDIIKAINNDREELEKLNTEYMQNNEICDKELARIGRIARQCAIGYAVCLTIEYIGKLTNTQEYVGFIFTLGNLFFAINLWEAGRSAYRINTCVDKTAEIEKKSGSINIKLLHKNMKNLRT